MALARKKARTMRMISTPIVVGLIPPSRPVKLRTELSDEFAADVSCARPQPEQYWAPEKILAPQ
jgi:hypothetical protein